MQSTETIKEVVEQLQNVQLAFTVQINSYQQLQRELAERLNYLITHDFSLVVSILYRLDISEKKLKQLLAQTREATAGDIIAELIVERQLQKIETRKAFKNNPPDIPEAERW
ncbi:hypothetical protein [Segetibacter aerophilus]|uniref:Uncharacterized protein n=1 Tax=Segetibacter aerophilus TaxID=670293 RepID=A0A512BBQ2_9BACT|nr:hypothetical protein [Segetibacter aerophilus]GEO09399.1 hypothetical protein SAE01_18950 [Segetibacter aerophilus]